MKKRFMNKEEIIELVIILIVFISVILFAISQCMEEIYLGDGVYASFDGYQIWLAANDSNNKVIALEPAVMDRLIEYSKMIEQKYKNEQYVKQNNKHSKGLCYV